MILYPHAAGINCGSSALRGLLAFHGLMWGPEPLSEEMVFGLSGGLGFVYAEVPEHSPPPPPLYLNGRVSDLEHDLCRTLGVGLDLRRTGDAQQSWQWVTDEIDGGRPTMVWADLKLLDYHRVQVNQPFHVVVVVGYDPAAERALLADHTFDELQRCSLASLAAARNSVALPGANEHGTFITAFPDRLPSPRDAIRQAIATTVENMRDGSAEPYPAVSGLAAVRLFADAFPRWPDRYGDGLGWALKGLRFFVARAGNDGALFRSLQARFLERAATLLDDRLLLQIGCRYEALALGWARLARRLRGPNAIALHRAAVDDVHYLAQREHEAAAMLEGWL